MWSHAGRCSLLGDVSETDCSVGLIKTQNEPCWYAACVVHGTVHVVPEAVTRVHGLDLYCHLLDTAGKDTSHHPSIHLVPRTGASLLSGGGSSAPTGGAITPIFITCFLIYFEIDTNNDNAKLTKLSLCHSQSFSGSSMCFHIVSICNMFIDSVNCS